MWKYLSQDLKANVKCFTFIKLDSSWKVSLSRNVLTNTVLDFVIVLYMPVKRQDLIFLKDDFSKTQEMKIS